jgi:hypothetical protein
LSRYSQLYIERGLPTPDSERARFRIFVKFVDMLSNQHKLGVEHLINQELGIPLHQIPDPECFGTFPDFEAFFLECKQQDFLDSITLVYKYMAGDYGLPASFPPHWATETDRILAEENMAFRVGSDGVVHPLVDEEFEVNQASALEALGEPRFGEARTDFEAAHRHLRSGKGKEALRMMFPAVEVASKVLFPGAFARLTPNEVDRHILPRMQARYAGNQPALDAGNRLLAGMRSWINAAQLYRHGQEIEDAAEPPTDFVVAHLSTGATYLRWMIELCSA